MTVVKFQNFTNISKKMDNSGVNTENCNIQLKHPKRILHFSDGTLEEYSDSENEENTKKEETNKTDVVDTAKLGWGPWLIHKAFQTGSATLYACDYVGEALANFLGITTPKYQYELDEYLRLQREQKKLQTEAENNESWVNSTTNADDTVIVNNIKLVAQTSNSNENNA